MQATLDLLAEAPQTFTVSSRSAAAPDQLRAQVHEIHAALDEVNPLTVEEWEAAFRHEKNPCQELAYWRRVAQQYRRAVAGRSDLNLAEKKRELHLILAGM